MQIIKVLLVACVASTVALANGESLSEATQSALTSEANAETMDARALRGRKGRKPKGPKGPKNGKTKLATEKFCVALSPGSPPTETEMDQFDTAVRITGSFVRTCSGCSEKSHKKIVYRRITPMPKDLSFGDLVFNTWSSENNILGTDFELYGSVKEASKQKNPWQFCNYDDEGVGFPRDCGETQETHGQWNSLDAGQIALNRGNYAQAVEFCTL